MYLSKNQISSDESPAEIVREDYRTADIFLKHGIDFCAEEQLPLSSLCKEHGIDAKNLLQELEWCRRSMSISGTLNYADWKIGFLTDYIENVHHNYLRNALPPLRAYVARFVKESSTTFDYSEELQRALSQFNKNILEHLDQEEDTIFPYIRQIGHAFYRKESYASLFVRTLRKPVEEIMDNEHHSTTLALQRFRTLTSNYALPENASLIQKVAFAKFAELDNNLMLHLHLENDILFPRALLMEKELLQQVG